MSRLRDLRIDAGLTQVQLADAASTTQNMISRFERGERSTANATLDVAARIAAALGVHAEELLDDGRL